MAQALCELQAELSTSNLHKRGRNKSGNLPSSRELANISQKNLRGRCSVGYRAKCIQRFAKKVESGEINLKKFEEEDKSYDEIYEELEKNYGFSDLTCANVLMCVGFYEKIPIDSETHKLLEKVYSKERTIERVEGVSKEIYDKYAPYECLAYWLELMNHYEDKVGRLCQLDRPKYHTVTLSEYEDGHEKVTKIVHEKKVKRVSKIDREKKNKRHGGPIQI